MSSPYPVRRVLAAACLLAVPACSGEGADDSREAEQPRLADLRGQVVLPARAEFCDRIDIDALVAAVGKPAGTRHHDNGEPARLAPGVRDVAHEFGCLFRGEADAVARAWVFVPPVPPARGREIARSLAGAPGCRPVDAGGFGRPSTGRVCADDGRRTASYHGLFGDAWFSCSLESPGLDGPELRREAEAWCVSALRAAASPL